jgi:hypothetical protein
MANNTFGLPGIDQNRELTYQYYKDAVVFAPGTQITTQNLFSASNNTNKPTYMRNATFPTTTGRKVTITHIAAHMQLQLEPTNALGTNVTISQSSLLDSSAGCDLPEIELQRWVNISIAVNGKTVDVYIDGKLTRSCILPNFFKVDGSGYSANLLMHGGFGGQISTTMMYDSALHPEAIYKNYIAGPEPITNLGDWLMSIFSFNVNVTVDTK